MFTAKREMAEVAVLILDICIRPRLGFLFCHCLEQHSSLYRVPWIIDVSASSS